MIVSQVSLVDFVATPAVVFQVPLFQRVYAWTQRQCEELWADLMDAAARPQGAEGHFMGTLLYDACAGAAGSAQVGDPLVLWRLIDGQQRFTTMVLLLLALRDQAQKVGFDAGPLVRKAMDERFFFVGAKGGARRAKLQLSRVDQPTLQALLKAAPLPEGDGRSALLADNYCFFAERLGDAGAIEAAWTGIKRLFVVAARLEEGDQPQSVFESLNSKGVALSASDLIRNLLFVHFGYERQERLYDAYWEPLEGLFPVVDGWPDLYIDAALHSWLKANAPEIRVQERSELYSAFKTYVRRHPELPLEDLLKGLNAHCVRFAQDLEGDAVRKHVDWVQGRLEGLVSERRLFGD